MSDHIPFEMQEEIMKRLPVKSLIQFRSVRRALSHHLLVGYSDLNEVGNTYLSIVDDNTFPQLFFAPTVPSSVKLLKDSKVFGSYHGLFCLYGYYYEDSDDDDYEEADYDSFESQRMAVLWNPSIRKSMAISLPDDSNGHAIVLGFGVCPVTSDPKILMYGSTREQVKVFMLKSGAWRSSTITLPAKLPNLNGSRAVVGRFIYWLAYDRFDVDGEFRNYNFIVSFDLTSNKFRIQHLLPISLALEPANKLYIFKRKESLAVIKYDSNTNLQGHTVWKMEHGVPCVFTKLYTLMGHGISINAPIGFRKSGEDVLEAQNDEHKSLGVAALADYKKHSKRLYYNEIYGFESSFCAYSYKETLLLLNQPDSVSFLALDEDANDY